MLIELFLGRSRHAFLDIPVPCWPWQGGFQRYMLQTRQNIARFVGEAVDPAGAAAAFQELLADQVRVLGPNHPDTTWTRDSLLYWQDQLATTDQ